MPTRDKKRGTWIGRVVLKGHQPQTKRGFKTKSEAVQWELHVKETIGNQSRGFSLFRAADMYLVNCQQRNAEHTVKYKARAMNILLEFLPDNPELKDITTIQVEEFLNTMPGKSANRYRRELNTFWRYAIKRGMATENPVEAIERYREEEFRRYVPPAEDVEAVFAVADPFEHNILTFCYHTLCRGGELRNCRWSDVDFERNTITLWTAKRQGGNKEDDTIDMTQTLQDMLWSIRHDGEFVFLRDGKQIDDKWLTRLIPRLCKKAGVDRFLMHSIRNHVASLLSYKLSLIQISKILRHKRLTTTDIYLRSLVKIKTDGIKVLDDMSKPSSGNVVPFLKRM